MILWLLLLYSSSSEAQFDSHLIQAIGLRDSVLEDFGFIGNLFSLGRINNNADLGANAEFGENSVLFNDTDRLMKVLKKEERMLAYVANDNYDYRKFMYSVIQYFYLEFVKIYTKYDDEELKEADEFNNAFDEALINTNKLKDSDATQFSAPVRRVSYVLNAVIDTLVEIVQSLCSPYLENWKCGARYYITLAAEASRCKNIWYSHHEIFVKSLKTVQKNKKTLLEIAENIISTVDFNLSGFRSTRRSGSIRFPSYLNNANLGSSKSYLASSKLKLDKRLELKLRDDLTWKRLSREYLNLNNNIYRPPESDLALKKDFSIRREHFNDIASGFTSGIRDFKVFTLKDNDDDNDANEEEDDIEEVLRSTLLDMTIKTLNQFRVQLKDSLLARAEIFRLVVDYSNEGKLDCILISRDPRP